MLWVGLDGGRRERRDYGSKRRDEVGLMDMLAMVLAEEKGDPHTTKSVILIRGC